MLNLVLRRAAAQWRLLAGVVALVTMGTTLLGVGALLLGVSQAKAFASAAQELTPREVDVTAYLVGLKNADQVEVRNSTRSIVSNALRHLNPTLTTTTVSRMRRLDDSGRIGYLASADSLTEHATLTSGRWPRSPGEAVVLDTTAAQVNLSNGTRVSLGKEIGTNPVDNEVYVVVVGTFRPTDTSSLDADPLNGRGYDANYTDGSVKAAAFGPLMVDDETLRASGSTLDSMQVTAHPSLDGADEASLLTSTRAVMSAGGVLSTRTAGQVEISRIATALSQTLAGLRAQQAATRSTVLVVLVLCTALALAALILAGRLLNGLRGNERALLGSFGLGRGQLVAVTLVETALIAVAATVVAVPAAAFAHAAVTHLPAMHAAGLSQAPGLTVGLALTEVIGALLLALSLAIPAFSPPNVGTRIAATVSYGTDLVLVAIAVAAWWQLHSQTSAVSVGDITRTLAPVACVLATTALAVRRAPLVFGLIARIAARRTSLVLPLASSQAARRPYAGVALILIAMATACATFGLTLQSTWARSAEDQAALSVGTDLSLEMTGPATAREAASIAAATKGVVASAVVNRSLALGRYVGANGSAPQLVAVDSRNAGALLSGRLDHGRTWSGVGALLSPGPAVEGLKLSTEGVRIEGGSSTEGASGIAVTPTLVIEDATGFRRSVTAEAVPLDGKPHRLKGLGNLDGTRLVANQLALDLDPGSSEVGAATVSVALSVPNTNSGTGDAQADWRVATLESGDSPVFDAAVSVARSPDEVRLRTTAQVNLQYLGYVDGELLETAFTTPSAVPVAVSQELVDAVGVEVGGELKASIGDANVPLKVVAIVPTVPSAPDKVAVLADADTLSRVLIGSGNLEPIVDAWWVAGLQPQTARAVSGLGLGDVTTRSGVETHLRQGPLRASLPASLSLLVGASVVLLLAGAALVMGADRPLRSAEVARLRALGLPRTGAVRLVLAEHGIVLSWLILTGVLVGGVTSVVLGPDLIRSDVGGAPVPGPLLEWPWLREVAVVIGLLCGCLVIASVVTRAAVRRSGPQQLRTADA